MTWICGQVRGCGNHKRKGGYFSSSQDAESKTNNFLLADGQLSERAQNKPTIPVKVILTIFPLSYVYNTSTSIQNQYETNAHESEATNTCRVWLTSKVSEAEEGKPRIACKQQKQRSQRTQKMCHKLIKHLKHTLKIEIVTQICLVSLQAAVMQQPALACRQGMKCFWLSSITYNLIKDNIFAHTGWVAANRSIKQQLQSKQGASQFSSFFFLLPSASLDVMGFLHFKQRFILMQHSAQTMTWPQGSNRMLARELQQTSHSPVYDASDSGGSSVLFPDALKTWT